MLAAVVVLLGALMAAVAAMTVAALPIVLGLGLTVLVLVTGVGARQRHVQGRHAQTTPAATDIDHDNPVGGPSIRPQLRWAVQWESPLPMHALPAIRERAAVVLAEWGLTGEAVEPALLVVTELVTNAVEHARSPRSLSLELANGSVRVEVRDDAAVPPQLGQPDPLQVRGRGLHLVEALSSRWGWAQDPPGKVIWAEVPTRWPA
jgi:anti-sigma regulatory factor (Ser/Thr protein kinase)